LVDAELCGTKNNQPIVMMRVYFVIAAFFNILAFVAAAATDPNSIGAGSLRNRVSQHLSATLPTGNALCLDLCGGSQNWWCASAAATSQAEYDARGNSCMVYNGSPDVSDTWRGTSERDGEPTVYCALMTCTKNGYPGSAPGKKTNGVTASTSASTLAIVAAALIAAIA